MISRVRRLIKRMIISDDLSIVGKLKAIMNERSQNLHGRNPCDTELNLKLIGSRDENKGSIQNFTIKGHKKRYRILRTI